MVQKFCLRGMSGNHQRSESRILGPFFFFFFFFFLMVTQLQPASVAQLDARPTVDQKVAGSTPPTS